MVPRPIPLSFLVEITHDFSNDQVIGRGEYSVDYKGVYNNGQVVVVKKINTRQYGQKLFEGLVECLVKAQHQNIVQFIGYCSDTQGTMQRYNGRYVMADTLINCICFEYLPNGSIDEHISEISCGLDWHARYKIIKGTCEGLRYLHMKRIVHLGLYPSNILLDENMMPKLTEIGNGDYAHRLGTREMGVIVYLAPEFLHGQVITSKIDIYSLGVLFFKIMTGDTSYPDRELVYEAWRKRLQKTARGKLVEGYFQQVVTCLQIAEMCVYLNPRKRPDMDYVVRMLNRIESFIQELALVHTELLDVQPVELCFLPFTASSSSSLEPIKKKKATMASSSCSLELNNRGHDRVAFMLVANSPKRYLTKKPLCGVVPPRCVYNLTLTIMPNKQQQPQSSSSNDDFFTLYSVMLGGYELLNVDKDRVIVEYDNFFKTKQTASGDEVQEVMLKVISDQPAAESIGTSSSEFSPAGVIKKLTRPTVEIITTPDAQQVSSVDVHPTEPWIMTTNHVGRLCVWNYQTMTTLNSFELAEYEPAKFITQEKWLIAGDDNGCIHVYKYDEKEHVKSVDAHDSLITTLAVHSTHPFVLSASSEDDDHLIKLWDWEKGWECTRTFQGHTDRVTQLKFNIDSFASTSLDGTVKIWSICSDDPGNIVTLDGKVDSLLCVDYFTRRDRLHLIVGCKDKTTQIWDLGMTEGRVHELEGHADLISIVTLHPELPLLITGSFDGTLRIWDSTTYKLEKIIGFNLGAVYALGCMKGSSRIVVGCHQGLVTTEISLPQSLEGHFEKASEELSSVE